MQRSAFTLVEVLVVVAIVGILVALLLPAVQAAREAARRTKCYNNLRQIALGVEGFHSVRKRFPPGRFGPPHGMGPDSTAWSWLAEILPFIEQNALYEQGQIPLATIAESGVADQQIPTFLCPSDTYSNRGPRDDTGDFPEIPLGQTNYKAVSGANWGEDGDWKFHSMWANPGTLGSDDGLAEGDGIMWRSDFDRFVLKRHVVDGLSRTFLIGEDLPEYNRWCAWPYANSTYGTCAIPLNFVYYDTYVWQNVWSFRSAHNEVVHFAFADGSVHSISADVSLDVYRALATRAGRETVGDY